ncbi:MAG: hypothetical protein GY749_47665 [Desulfobacteraceae bacterium]|nr:hypothetical protein [Desulfobacteraceae bacterium]
MKLNDFISETLKQIIDGVHSVKDYALEKGVKLNPDSARVNESNSNVVMDFESGGLIQIVEFDVGLIVSEGQKTGDDSSIVVGDIKVTPQQKLEMQNSTVSRIKFSIPLKLPKTKDMKDIELLT